MRPYVAGFKRPMTVDHENVVADGKAVAAAEGGRVALQPLANKDGVVVNLAAGLGAPGHDPARIVGVLLCVVLADVVANCVVA